MQKIKSFLWSLIFVAASFSLSVVADQKNNFEKVSAYMKRYYILGYHSGNKSTDLYQHKAFLKDFENNQLFKDFKKALLSQDANEAAMAKKTFESILKDLETCLSGEQSYQVKIPAMYKKMVIFLGLLEGSLVSKWLFDYVRKIKCNFGIKIGAGYAGVFFVCSPLIKKMMHSYMESNIEALKQRIEVWSQLLPVEA